MAEQAPRRTIQELRNAFGQVYDDAAALAASFKACGCGRGPDAQDGQDLNDMVQALLPVRQRAGGCPCGPPCDGTSVENPSDETLQEMLARLQWDVSQLDENLVPCGCADRPEVVEEEDPEVVVEEEPEPVRGPMTLMTLPGEIRDMIWWLVLRPDFDNGRYVRVVQRHLRPLDESREHWFHRPRFTTRLHPTRLAARVTFQREGEQENINNRWALLRVNRQVYREAEDEYWRRALAEGRLFSFSPSRISELDDFWIVAGVETYSGVVAAWTFFNHYRNQYLQNIRRMQLHLTFAEPRRHNLRGVGEQALAVGGNALGRNGANYLNPLLDMIIAGNLPNLQHLALTFGGWVPDMSVQPWREGRPNQPWPAQSSVGWVTRLRNIRGLRRLRLRVVFASAVIQGVVTAPGQETPEVRRAIHFVGQLRRSMLLNGQALGNGYIRASWERPEIAMSRITMIRVECDDSWDEDIGGHRPHEDGEYDDDPLL